MSKNRYRKVSATPFSERNFKYRSMALRCATLRTFVHYTLVSVRVGGKAGPASGRSRRQAAIKAADSRH
jgi:hypothetical protein